MGKSLTTRAGPCCQPHDGDVPCSLSVLAQGSGCLSQYNACTTTSITPAAAAELLLNKYPRRRSIQRHHFSRHHVSWHCNCQCIITVAPAPCSWCSWSCRRTSQHHPHPTPATSKGAVPPFNIGYFSQASAKCCTPPDQPSCICCDAHAYSSCSGADTPGGPRHATAHRLLCCQPRCIASRHITEGDQRHSSSSSSACSGPSPNPVPHPGTTTSKV